MNTTYDDSVDWGEFTHLNENGFYDDSVDWGELTHLNENGFCDDPLESELQLRFMVSTSSPRTIKARIQTWYLRAMLRPGMVVAHPLCQYLQTPIILTRR